MEQVAKQFDKVGIINGFKIVNVEALFNHYFEDTVSCPDLKALLEEAYRIAKIFDKDFDLELDQDSSVSEALLLVLEKIQNGNKYIDFFIEDALYYVKYLEVSVFGVIPLKPFYDMRKKPKIYNILLKVLGKLERTGINMYDTGMAEMVYEELDNLFVYDKECGLDAVQGLKWWNKIIQPFTTKVSKATKRLSIKEINYVIEHEPKFKEFLEDFKKIYKKKINFYSHYLQPCANDSYNGIMEPQDCYQFLWTSTDSDLTNPFDQQIINWCDDCAANLYIPEPAIIIDTRNIKNGNSIRKLNRIEAESLIYYNLFHKDYEIFR